MANLRDFLPPPPWEGPPIPRYLAEYRKGSKGGNPGKVYTILDSKGTPHELEERMMGFIPTRKLLLDGRLILVDDQLGWIYPDPFGRPKQVRDKTLRDNIDKVVFGRIMPTGADDEEE